jgi:hypothetical protein
VNTEFAQQHCSSVLLCHCLSHSRYNNDRQFDVYISAVIQLYGLKSLHAVSCSPENAVCAWPGGVSLAVHAVGPDLPISKVRKSAAKVWQFRAQLSPLTNSTYLYFRKQFFQIDHIYVPKQTRLTGTHNNLPRTLPEAPAVSSQETRARECRNSRGHEAAHTPTPAVVHDVVEYATTKRFPRSRAVHQPNLFADRCRGRPVNSTRRTRLCALAGDCLFGVYRHVNEPQVPVCVLVCGRC